MAESGLGEYESAEGLGARLIRFLTRHDERHASARVVDIRPIGGGYSRQMCRVTLDIGGQPDELVLRSDPVGQAMIDTDRAVEWSVLQALAKVGGVAISVPRWFDEAGEITGAPALLVDYVCGSPWSRVPPEEADGAMLARKLGDLAGTVHAIPVGVLPAELESPPSWSDYIDGRIGKLRQAERAFPGGDPVLRYLVSWLDANRPVELPLTLVHGDFQVSNVLLQDDGNLVLLDWELARIGDPREDLGYLGIVGAVSGVDPLAEHYGTLHQAYRAATGLGEDTVNRQTIAYFAIISAIEGVVRFLQPLGAAAGARAVPTDIAYVALGLTGFRAALIDATTTATERGRR
ncbi:phosphotransferase family protein [Mycobacterium sp. C31M]